MCLFCHRYVISHVVIELWAGAVLKSILCGAFKDTLTSENCCQILKSSFFKCSHNACVCIYASWLRPTWQELYRPKGQSTNIRYIIITTHAHVSACVEECVLNTEKVGERWAGLTFCCPLVMVFDWQEGQQVTADGAQSSRTPRWWTHTHPPIHTHTFNFSFLT